MGGVRGWELAAGVAAGLLAGFLLWGRSSETPGDGQGFTLPAAGSIPAGGAQKLSSAIEQEVVRLRERLQSEAIRREALERQLAQREEAREVRSSALASLHSGPAAPERSEVTSRRTTPRGWPEPRILLQAGLTPAEIDELRERFEAIELERLYVRDQATREGWLGKPRFRRRMGSLDARYRALGDEYGEGTYDWILYASGHKNRVQVTSVMQGSAAADAGLEAGDVVVGYDDQRIFDGASLQRATTSGEAGETVVIDVVRDGERVRLYPPRGPLGITLDAVRVEPGPLD